LKFCFQVVRDAGFVAPASCRRFSISFGTRKKFAGETPATQNPSNRSGATSLVGNKMQIEEIE
jgi:hypothetical protein